MIERERGGGCVCMWAAVRKKQRIKRDRMLTNFMSLFLEGRLFVLCEDFLSGISPSLSLKTLSLSKRTPFSPFSMFFPS